MKDISSQSDDTKDIAKKPCRPLVFCGPPGVDISSIIKGMAVRVVEFSNGVYKIRKIFAEESIYPKEIIEF